VAVDVVGRSLDLDVDYQDANDYGDLGQGGDELADRAPLGLLARVDPLQATLWWTKTAVEAEEEQHEHHQVENKHHDGACRIPVQLRVLVRAARATFFPQHIQLVARQQRIQILQVLRQFRVYCYRINAICYFICKIG